MAFTLEFMQNITKDPETQARQRLIVNIIERIKLGIMAGHYIRKTCLSYPLTSPRSYPMVNPMPTTCIRDELVESLQKEFPGCLVFASDTDVHIDWTIS